MAKDQAQPRAAVWAAVSSRPQATPEKDSIELQLEKGRQYARDRSWLVVAELVIPGETREYTELSEAIVGLAAELRPGERNAYADLKDLLDKRAIDFLICRGRDRLGREDSLVSVIENKARKAGCVVHSMTMPATGQTDSDLFLAAIERAGAQRELVELRRRIHFGMNNRAGQGKPVASVLPFGYRAEYVDGKRVAEVDPAEAEAYRWAVRSTLDGMTQIAIRAELHRQFPHRFKTDTSVRYMLRNPFYVGKVVRRSKDLHGKPVVVEAEGQHEALIDLATWNDLQDFLDVRAKRRGTPHLSLWSGILFCYDCKSIMWYSSAQSGWQAGKFYQGYQCSTYFKDKTEKRYPTRCNRNYIALEKITGAMVKYLEDLFVKHQDQIDAFLRPDQEADEERESQLVAQLAQIDAARKRLIYLFTNSSTMDVDDYDREAGALQARQQAIEDELTAIRKGREDAAHKAETVSLVREILPELEERLAAAKPEEANRWLRQIFKAVYVKGGRPRGKRYYARVAKVEF